MPRHPRFTRRKSLQHFHTALADALECRCLLSTSELAQIPAVLAHPSDAAQDDITLSDYLSDAETAQIVTNLGEIDITFTPDLTPLTVNDFAEYAVNGLYDNTFFHRSAFFETDGSEVGGSPANPANIVQGGGLVATAQTDSNGNTTYVPDQINTFAPVVDEADSSLSNLSGTIALARTSDPNSGTSEFYFNVTDNTEFDYDPTTDNPGYAVFGNVTSGMSVVDQIAALNTDSSLFGSYGLTEVPVTSTPATVNDLVTISSVTVPSNCTYSATSSQPGLVRPIVNGDALSFAYGNAIGTADVTVTATEILPAGSTATPTTASETFVVTVPPLASSPLASVSGPIVSAQTFTFNNVLGQQDGPFYLLNSASDNTGTIDPTSALSAYTLPTHGTLYNDGENDGGLTYVPDVGFTGTDFFEYQATDSNGVTSAPAIVSLVIDPAPVVATIGFHAAPSLHFVQPDGTVGVIRVTTGNAAITLTGTNPSVSHTAAGLFATGVNISNIVLTNPTDQYVSLVIQGFAGANQGKIVVGGISDTTGNVFDLVGRTTELTGTSSFVGVANVELDELDNATVNITKDDTGWKIQNAIDSSITGEAGFRQLRANSWTTDNVNNYYIEGLFVTSMYISGNFDETLDINGEYARHTIGLVRIAGTVGTTVPIPWYFNGTVGKIEARAVAPDTLSISSAGNPDPTGPNLYLNFLANLQLGGNVTGVGISAGAIGTVSIGGSLTDSGIETVFGYSPRVTQMQHINVRGNIVDSSISSVGNMGIVTATGMAQSIVAAGVNEADLELTGPLIDSSADLITQGTQAAIVQSTIGAVRLGGRAPTFADSRIAAAHIGALTLGAITDDNGGTPMGISAESVAALGASLVSGGKLALGRAQLSSAAAWTAYLAKHPYTLDDFAIDLFSAPS